MRGTRRSPWASIGCSRRSRISRRPQPEAQIDAPGRVRRGPRQLTLTVGGDRFQLAPGDVVVFRGDQRHGYHNEGTRLAVGYSIVMFAPVEAPAR